LRLFANWTAVPAIRLAASRADCARSNAPWPLEPEVFAMGDQEVERLRAHRNSIQRYRRLLATYCVTCHNQRAKTGGLSLMDNSVKPQAALL